MSEKNSFKFLDRLVFFDKAFSLEEIKIDTSKEKKIINNLKFREFVNHNFKKKNKIYEPKQEFKKGVEYLVDVLNSFVKKSLEFYGFDKCKECLEVSKNNLAAILLMMSKCEFFSKTTGALFITHLCFLKKLILKFECGNNKLRKCTDTEKKKVECVNGKYIKGSLDLQNEFENLLKNEIVAQFLFFMSITELKNKKDDWNC